LAALLGAIDAFLEFEDMALRDVKTGRGLHVDFFLKIGLKICGLNIHLVNFKIVFGGEGENGVEQREFGDWCKGLIKVDTFDLGESLHNDACLVFLYAAVGSTFDAEDPFATYDFVAFQPGDNIIYIQVLPSAHLFFIGS